MCCSMIQLSVNFTKTSARATGRSLRGQSSGKCWPWRSGFFGPQSSGAIVAAVHSFAVWYGTTACVHVPSHSRRNVSVSPGAEAQLARQHNTPGHSFHQLRRWGVRISPRLV